MPDMKIVKEFLKMKKENPNELVSAVMMDEINSCVSFEIDDFFMNYLLSIGLDFYYDIEYASATGIGVAIGQWVSDNYIEGMELLEKIKDAIYEKYISLDWR